MTLTQECNPDLQIFYSVVVVFFKCQLLLFLITDYNAATMCWNHVIQIIPTNSQQQKVRLRIKKIFQKMVIVHIVIIITKTSAINIYFQHLNSLNCKILFQSERYLIILCKSSLKCLLQATGFCIIRAPDKVCIFNSTTHISSLNPMFDHLFESSQRDDSNK